MKTILLEVEDNSYQIILDFIKLLPQNRCHILEPDDILSNVSADKPATGFAMLKSKHTAVPTDFAPASLLQEAEKFREKSIVKEAVFNVNVSVCDGIWTAECDELGLVTEADNYQELTERAWEIAPELAELNALTIAGDIRLQFTHEKSVARVA